MRIYLFHTSDVDDQDVKSIYRMLDDAKLRTVQVVQAKTSKADVDMELGNRESDASPLPWNHIFSSMQKLRKAEGCAPDDFVFLLTERKNALNWFSFHEPSEGTGANVCIHTADWREFMPGVSDCIFPVAHLVASNVLHRLVYPTMEQWRQAAHEKPEGCLMDFCQNKREIRLKLKAADVCPICQPAYREAIEEGRLDSNVLLDCLNMLDVVRRGFSMSNRLELEPRPSRLAITDDAEVRLVDFGQVVKLPPQERALYLYFLEQTAEGGIHPRNVDRDRLRFWYQITMRDEDLDEVERRVERMIDPERMKAFISIIRSVFNGTVGVKLTNEHYLWPPGTRVARRIAIDRDLVEGLDRFQAVLTLGKP